MEEDFNAMFADAFSSEEEKNLVKKSAKRQLFAVDKEELRQWLNTTDEEKFRTPISELPKVATDPQLLNVPPGVDLYYTDPNWKKTKTGKQRIRKVRKPRVTTREQRRIMKQEKDSGTRWRTKFPNQKEIEERKEESEYNLKKRKREWMMQKLERQAEEYTAKREQSKAEEEQRRMLLYLGSRYPKEMKQLSEQVQPIQQAYDAVTLVPVVVQRRSGFLRTMETL